MALFRVASVTFMYAEYILFFAEFCPKRDALPKWMPHIYGCPPLVFGQIWVPISPLKIIHPPVMIYERPFKCLVVNEIFF